MGAVGDGFCAPSEINSSTNRECVGVTRDNPKSNSRSGKQLQIRIPSTPKSLQSANPYPNHNKPSQNHESNKTRKPYPSLTVRQFLTLNHYEISTPTPNQSPNQQQSTPTNHPKINNINKTRKPIPEFVEYTMLMIVEYTFLFLHARQ